MSTAKTDPSARSAVRAYAAEAGQRLDDEFFVRSYVGLWLLLAWLGPLTCGACRAELEAALDVPAERAAELAVALLAERRGDLDAAVAGWLFPGPRWPRP